LELIQGKCLQDVEDLLLDLEDCEGISFNEIVCIFGAN
jgi:hypothetical protein